MKSKLFRLTSVFFILLTTCTSSAVYAQQSPSVIYAVTGHLEENAWVHADILQQRDYPQVGQPVLIADADSHQWTDGFSVIQTANAGILSGHVY